MKLGEVIKFRKDLYFEGAVQADWFYSPDKSSLVAENFVFHGSKYFNNENKSSENKAKIDTISLAEELLAKVNGEDNLNPLTLAIADYGTGKSHLSVALSHLFSGSSYMPETYDKIIKNIGKIDREASLRIKKLSTDKNFVIVLNGMRDFNLHSELLKATQRSLKLYGLSDDILKSINKAAEVADIFLSKNKIRIIDDLEEAASKYGWLEKGDTLIDKLVKNIYTDDDAFDIVNEVYENQNGIKIRWDEGIQATNIIEKLINEFCGFNGQFDHIVILFDEFGRYLEYASGTDAGRSGDSALQQIFESIQNSNGLVHIINFIQSDIKTYLQRVDQSKNISRYINRYDNSDKYYISSNLETVFANLIERTDASLFNDIVVKEIIKNDSNWRKLFDDLNRWTRTKGIWKEYKTFKNIVVEGIYPLHPLSTFVLTQLSDYLQNRSSLTMISQYINQYSDLELDSNFRIYPEMLMSGDLFAEFYSAEQEGKQSSQQCIAYSNVLRKYNGKLDEDSLKVLRSNLVVRLLKFSNSSYDDVLTALSYCSGLTISRIKEVLKIVEDEYGILGFDSYANCFDFMEDATGAYDYKNFKNKLIKSVELKPNIFDDFKIKTFAEVIDNQNTNISSDYYISTAEWQFKQELVSIDCFQSSEYNTYVKDWKDAYKSYTPKGRLVWLYANKETDEKYFDKIYKLAGKVEGKAPIVFMLLNDAEDKLNRLLREYVALENIEDRDKIKYERFYNENIEQLEENIKIEFSNLKRERNVFKEYGLEQCSSRLPIYLTNVFEDIYPNIIPFMFDGFVKNGKISPKAGTQFCVIVRLLLSNSINYDSIHSLPQEVRNKIDSLFMDTSYTSWKCITEDYKLKEPNDGHVEKIYKEITHKINKDKGIDLESIFDKLVKPPYGFSEDIITMLVAVIIANLSYCLRIEYEGETLQIKDWIELVVVKDKKINYDVIKNSSIIKIDVDQITAEFVRLFDEINANKSVSEIEKLKNELHILAKQNPVPEDLKGNYKLAQTILSNGEGIRHKWEDALSEGKEAIAIAMINTSSIGELFYSQVNGLHSISKIDFDKIFLPPFRCGAAEKIQYINLSKELTSNIYLYVDDYIASMHVKQVSQINTFKNHNNKIMTYLNEINLYDVEKKIREKTDKVLENVQDIRDAENIVNIYKEFMDKTKNYESFVYTEVENNLTRGQDVKSLVIKFKSAFYDDYDNVIDELRYRLAKLEEKKQNVLDDMNAVWEFIDQMDSYDDLSTLLTKIDVIIKYGIKKSDIEDYLDLQTFTKELISKLNDYFINAESVEQLESNHVILKDYYDNYEDNNEELDLIFEPYGVIDGTFDEIKNKLNRLEEEWIKDNLSIGNYNNDQLRSWKTRVSILPKFLSDGSRSMVKDKIKEVETKLSDSRIENAVYYFDQLTDEEKEKFLEMIKNGK